MKHLYEMACLEEANKLRDLKESGKPTLQEMIYIEGQINGLLKAIELIRNTYNTADENGE